jgi:VWFA-related protein
VKKALALAAVAFVSILEAQSVIRSDSRLVLVDSIVQDSKGVYLHGLTQKDFKVWEDGKEQAITTFSVEANRASSSDDQQQHNLVFFFDNSTVPMEQRHYAREAALKFIESNSGLHRLMAVVIFGGTLRVRQNFTDDEERLKQALTGADVDSITNDVGLGRRGDTVLTNYSTRTMLGAVRDLAARLAALPGRKTVVLFSGGFRARPDELNLVISACNRANVAVYPVDMRGLAAMPQNYGSADARAPDGMRPHSRGDRSAQGPMGAAGDAGDPAVQSAPDTLHGLAKGTGGFAISRTNDLLAGVKKIGSEQSEYYMLGYVPAQEPKPGACHAIKVKVDQRGVNVRSRNGYCETKNLVVPAGTPMLRDLESELTTDAASTVEASMQAPFFYVSPGIARVDVALDIAGGGFKFTNDKGNLRSTLNVIGIAYLPDGNVAARFSNSVNLTLDSKKQIDEFASRAYHYETQFEIPSGQFHLKVAFSSSAGSFGKTQMPLTVDPWKPTQFIVSGLALSKSAHAVSKAGSESGAALLGDKTPLVAEGVQFIPSGTNHFRKSEKGFIYGEIYEPALALSNAKEDPALYAQMLLLDAKSGQIVKDFGMNRVKAEVQPGNPAVPLVAALPIERLPPGVYIAYINALDSAGRRFTRRIGFAVDP